MSLFRIFHIGFFVLLSAAASADAPNRTMTVERLEALLEAVDETVKRAPRGYVWALTIEGVEVTVIADPDADRMRMVAAVMPAGQLNEAMQLRILQANFDSALDARYAIAQDVVWSTFIHPLGSLTDRQALSGLGQTVNLVKSFGTTFSSGALLFGGGDSQSLLQRELIDRLLRKGIAI